MEGCKLASAVLTLEIHFTSKVNTVNASGEALSLSGEAPPTALQKGRCVQDGTEASGKLCTRQKCTHGCDPNQT